jgi:hypothetical protein
MTGPDRPTEPLSIWLRNHSRHADRHPHGGPEHSPGRPWWEHRLFWVAIASIAIASVGLFSAAALLGPIRVPGQLESSPGTYPAPAQLPALKILKTHPDSAPESVPVLLLPATASTPGQTAAQTPARVAPVPSARPIEAARPAPDTAPAPETTPAQTPSSATSAPVSAPPFESAPPTVPYSPSYQPVSPDPSLIPSDPSASWGRWPGHRDSP